MKKIIPLFMIFSLLASVAIGQNFTFDDDAPSGMADLSDMSTGPDDIVAHSTVTNQTSGTLNLRWERTVIEIPDGWKTAVCDLNNCYLPSVSTMDFELEPNQTGTMDVHAYPGGNPGILNDAMPGTAVVEIKVINIDDDTEFLVGTYTITLEQTVSVSEIDKASLRVFPNPAVEYFQVKGAEHVTSIILYDILGRPIRNYGVMNTTQEFPVGDLPTGFYLVKLLDDNDDTLKVLRLKKQ